MEEHSIYEQIAARTGGSVYIGVVGPVRTGKSTFVKRLMEQLVLPNIEDPYRRERAQDELPQAASGRTIDSRWFCRRFPRNSPVIRPMTTSVASTNSRSVRIFFRFCSVVRHRPFRKQSEKSNYAIKSAGFCSVRPKCHKIACTMRSLAWPSP